MIDATITKKLIQKFESISKYIIGIKEPLKIYPKIGTKFSVCESDLHLTGFLFSLSKVLENSIYPILQYKIHIGSYAFKA